MEKVKDEDVLFCEKHKVWYAERAACLSCADDAQRVRTRFPEGAEL